MTKAVKIFRNIILIGFISLLLQSCSMNNAKFFRKGDVTLVGHGNESSNPRYTSIGIGNLNEPIKSFPEIYLELQNQKKYYLPEVTVEYLRQGGFESKPITKEMKGWYPICPENSSEYWLEPMTILTATDKYVYTFSSYPVAIWNKTQNKCYKMPLTDEQAIELFGKPDKIEYGFGGW